MEDYRGVREAVRSGGKVSPFYLLFGDAGLLKEELVRDLRRRLVPGDAAAFDYHAVPDEGEESLLQALEAARMPPLVGERRLLVARDRGWFGPASARGAASAGAAADVAAGGAEGEPEEPPPAPGVDRCLEAFAAYLAQPPDTACLVVLAGGLDQRRRVVKSALAAAAVVPCQTPRGRALVGWLVERAAGMGKRLDTDAAWALSFAVGPDLGLLARELEKLATYAGQSARIDRAAVELLTPGGAQDTVFAMADALGEGRPGRALDLLHGLLRRGEPPLRLLAMVARHVRALYAARSLIEEGRPPGDLSRAMGVPPFLAQRYADQAGRLDRGRLEEAVLALHGADVDIKTGRLPPAEALELAWLRISGRVSSSDSGLMGAGAAGGARAPRPSS